MEFIWILFAFIFGVVAKVVQLPPSIGYLAAGFILNYLGFQGDGTIKLLADLGITLMLFMIGLKLNVKDLLKQEVWATSLSHMTLWIVFTVVCVKLFAFIAIHSFTSLSLETSLLIAFALSFSSTVCVVKLMEENGEMKTRHGKLSISVLVMQDVVAVGFLVAATGKQPAVYALALLALFAVRPLIYKIIDKVGHGELIPLTGFFMALGAYELFEAVNIKGDLGALIIGMFLAGHSKASEISKALLSFKDLFLIGFFLTIGFTALPNWEMLGIALILTLMLPVKFIMFFALFNLVKLKARTSFLSALALTNFSEFGLIVAALSEKSGWLNKEWLVILSIAVSLSFILTNVVYRYAHEYYRDNKDNIKRFERDTRLAEDIFTQPAKAPVLVIGMGRVGMGAYYALNEHHPGQVWGVDADKEKMEKLQKAGMNAFVGDGEDADFWDNINMNELKLVMLALPSVQDSKNIAYQLCSLNFKGKIAAIARYDDEREELEESGIDKVFNFFAEAGVGFAKESMDLVGKQEAKH